jgi:glycosyltransferase involved in cell wall biosynthesis
MSTVSVVIPALNEAENIPSTLAAIPVFELQTRGYEVEILVVDNGSSDRTGHIAREHGARVIVQPVRGYGNAYKAGFANSVGDIIATGDADLTYPFEILPEMLAMLSRDDLEFLTTDRLGRLRREAMSRTHAFGNRFLSAASTTLFGDLPFRDSQSGMWVFRRYVWNECDVRSGSMAFSQEIKVEAYRRGFRCAEIPIDYYPRGGRKKLRTVRDGLHNLGQLFLHRLRAQPPATGARTTLGSTPEVKNGRRSEPPGRRLADPALGLSAGSKGAVAVPDPAKPIAPALFTPDRRGEVSGSRAAEL